MMNNEQKIFRDFFGRDIKIGDRVIHLWATVTHLGISGGTSAIKHKLAKVIGFSKKGVKIEWSLKKSSIQQSTIFNTRNRLIILKNNVPEIDEEIIVNEAVKEYESYKKGLKTRILNLKNKIISQENRIENILSEKEKLEKEVKYLKNEIKEFRSRVSRFELMDI